jgi:hypothetical protein
MPLKLADINAPVSTNIINTWADEQEATVTQHSTQLTQVLTQFRDLIKKNPTLIKPVGF